MEHLRTQLPQRPLGGFIKERVIGNNARFAAAQLLFEQLPGTAQWRRTRRY